MTRTQTGRSMQALSQNAALARIVGIDVAKVVRVTWIIGGALACVAGVMIGILVQIRPFMGFDMLLPMFAAAILGGIGSVPGAVLGGLIIGLAEAGAVQLIGAEWRAAVSFIILMAVLFVRPDRHFRSERTMMDLLGYGAFFLTTALIFSLVTLGLNLQWGLTGPLQCRCRRLRRDWRLHLGAVDHAGRCRAPRRLRPADRRRLARRDDRRRHRRRHHRHRHACA